MVETNKFLKFTFPFGDVCGLGLSTHSSSFHLFIQRKSHTPNMPTTVDEVEEFFNKGKLFEKEENLEAAKDSYEKGLNILREIAKDSAKGKDYKRVIGEKRDIEKRLAKLKNDTLETVQEFELIFSLPEVVQLCSLDNGHASATSELSSLQILKSGENVFLQVGKWVYPLEKGKTPILRNEFGAYVVSNPSTDDPDRLMAILLPENLDDELLNEFHAILAEFSVLRWQNVAPELSPEEKARLSHRISQFLIKKSLKAAKKFENKTEKLSADITEKGKKYRAKTQPKAKPMHIPDTVKGGVIYMRKGTTVVAKVTQKIVDVIGDVSNAVGKKVAQGAQKVMDKDGKGPQSGAVDVLGGGIIGVGAIFKSLQTGSKTLMQSLASNAVQNVHHKYGDEAALTTSEALRAGESVADGGLNLFKLTNQSLVKVVGVGAGVKTVTDLYTTNCLNPEDPLMRNVFAHMNPEAAKAIAQAQAEAQKTQAEPQQQTVKEPPPSYELYVTKKSKHL